MFLEALQSRASRPARFLSAESGESHASDSPLSALRNRAGRDARCISAPFSDADDVPGWIKKEITFGPTPVSASRKGMKDALGPRTHGSRSQLEDDAASGVVFVAEGARAG